MLPSVSTLTLAHSKGLQDYFKRLSEAKGLTTSPLGSSVPLVLSQVPLVLLGKLAQACFENLFPTPLGKLALAVCLHF